MVLKPQKTKFQLKVLDNFEALSNWALNPWRRFSLALIIFLIGFYAGTQLGMISAVYTLMDPVGAFISVLIIEVLIRLRRISFLDKKKKLFTLLVDFLRIGLCYGFIFEGLKLL